jgi:hypothetical protein
MCKRELNTLRIREHFRVARVRCGNEDHPSLSQSYRFLPLSLSLYIEISLHVIYLTHLQGHFAIVYPPFDLLFTNPHVPRLLA